MRILHVIQEVAGGGAERVVLSLRKGALEVGHEVAVAAAPGSLSLELNGDTFDLPLVERRLSRIPRAARALRRALREFRPDIVHVHNPGMTAVAAVATMRGRRVPTLVTVHGVPDEDYPAAARVLRLAGFPVVACGPGVALALREGRVSVEATIVNGVAPPPAAAERANLCAEWNIPVERPLVLSVGRLIALKNHSLAISALAHLPEASLVIVGEGPLVGELKRQAVANGVSDRVVLAGLRTDARALIGAADAVCLTSTSEGLPLVALEALAASKPLVATDARGSRELLTDGVDALLVPVGDAAALASALARTLDDMDLVKHLAEGARRTASKYSEGVMVSTYLDLYERMRR